MSEPLLRFVDVSKRFGPRVVLDHFGLEVRRGETLALLGRSGVGKSVTLRLTLGLTRPDAGEITFDGVDVARSPERRLREVRRRIGMVFQGGALFDSLTVAENVAYPLREQRWTEARIGARVAECLALVDLPGTEELLPGALSGGMRKRVAVARAIAAAPELLLYDEPTTGLDPATARHVNELIVSLQRRLGETSIVVTHDLDSVFAVADRIALLHEGRVVWLGDTAAARADPPPALAWFMGDRMEEPWRPPVDSP